MDPILVGTKFRRPKAPIEFGDGISIPKKAYYFTPLDADNPLSVHACEIDDSEHLSILLGIPGRAYWIIDKKKDPNGTAIGRPTGNGAAKLASVPRGAPGKKIDGPVAGATPPRETLNVDLAKSISDLTSLGPKDFKQAVKAAPLEVLREVLSIEKARPEADERPTYIAALEAQLGKED